MRLKSAIKAIFQKFFFWQIIKGITKGIDRIHFYNNELIKDFKRKADEKFIIEFNNNLVVRGGIFTGLHYPYLKSFGSMIYPKLIGCYEDELHSVFNKLLEKKITQIVDIGCAEGYYAVGMAYKLPNAKIIAFDIDEKALEMAAHLAEINNVKNQILFEREANRESLVKLNIMEPTLIICDCEGYEIELFNEAVIAALQDAYLLIETHDFINPVISEELNLRLSSTHQVQVIPTKTKTNYKKYTFFQSLNSFEKEYYSNEYRPAKMTWLYCVPKSNKF